MSKDKPDILLNKTISLDVGHLDMMLQLALEEDELKDEN